MFKYANVVMKLQCCWMEKRLDCCSWKETGRKFIINVKKKKQTKQNK
jgi:hypothetical protein